MVLEDFFVLEGIDGSGTSTQLQRLAPFLSQRGIDARFTREPTDSPIGQLLRSFLTGTLSLSPAALALLFAADRSEHLYGKEGVLTTLRPHQWLFCDRYLFSTLAYQGLHTDMHTLYQQNKDFPLPSLLFFIDTPPAEADKRITHRNRQRETYESLPLQERIRENYFRAFDFFRGTTMKIILLDGNDSIDSLFNRICAELPLPRSADPTP